MCVKRQFSAGLAQVLQHAEKSHIRIKLAKIAYSDGQSKIAFKTIQNFQSIEPQNTSEVIVSEIGPVPVHNVLLTNRKVDTAKAEIIWATKTANDNYSFRSSDGVGDTFRAMFSNPGTLETFSMSRTKLSYAIRHGIGLVFKEELISDVRASQSPFSLQYDETTQCQVKKQTELHIRYWSPVHNEVWIRYYSLEFFGHAEGATVANAIVSAFKNDNVPVPQLLTLGNDGPNVNKTIWRELEQKIRRANPDFQGFVDFGTCNIHIVHKSFGKGLDVRPRILKINTITMIIFYILMRCVFSLHSRSLARVSRLSSVFCACVNKTTKEFEGGRVSPQSYITPLQKKMSYMTFLSAEKLKYLHLHKLLPPSNITRVIRPVTVP